MKQELIIAKPAELILKSSPVRRIFERQLVRNIEAKLGKVRIERLQARLLIYSEKIDKLKNVFGLSVIHPAFEVKTDLDVIQKKILKIIKLDKSRTFAVRARRVTKDFPLTSQQINEKIGDFVRKKTKAKVDLENPNVEINVEIIGKRTLLFTEKIRCLGGLPVGVSGKVVCLTSGGIDSPVAAWMMLKRGCEIIPVHMKISEVEYKKFLKLCKKLQEYSGPKIEMVVVDWNKKLKAITNKLRDKRYTCIMCKHLMLLEAQKIAESKNAKAIVIGSSIGQVASQTLDNIMATHYGLELPVLTPLIGFNKDETEAIARQIGTFDISISKSEPCPYVPSRPATRIKLEEFKKLRKFLC